MSLRAPSSPGIGCMHRIPASARSSESRTGCGARASGRGARSSSRKPSQDAPRISMARGEARGDFVAGAIGDERDAFAGLNREAGFDGVARARDELCLSRLSRHTFVL